LKKENYVSSNKKTALILGSSGVIGQYCLEFLLEKEGYEKVIALVRRELPATSPKLTQIVVDFDNTNSMEKYYAGVDDVFCCLGTSQNRSIGGSVLRRVNFHIPIESANMAYQYGVKQFVIISVKGADNHSSDIFLRVKGEMERGLAQFNFEAVHIFRPFFSHIEESKSRNIIKSLITKILNINTDRTFHSLLPDDIEILAKTMVEVAQKHLKGKHVYKPNKLSLSIGSNNVKAHQYPYLEIQTI